MSGFRLIPPEASTIAAKVDALFWTLVGVSAFFAGLVFLLLVIFMVRYRRSRTGAKFGEPPATDAHVPGPGQTPHHAWAMALEITWTVIPLGISIILFVWSSRLFFEIYTPPPNAVDIYVVGKQWMWKIQHPEGQREINQLHVPVGRPVRLTITSEDVIHDFFVPDFRIKIDAVPGRYTQTWFQATKTGRYHIFCAQYCGTDHSLMAGYVTVMEPAEYERWLGARTAETLPTAGEALFSRLGCTACHLADSSGRGPSLAGLYGRRVTLADGKIVAADETYLRESITNPAAQIVAGYPPIMPTYQGRVSEEEMLQLLAYIKSLAGEPSRPQQ